MGYIYIFLSIFFNAAKGYSSKKVSASLKSEHRNILFNTKRMLLSFVFAFAVVLLATPIKELAPSFTELLICSLSGLSMTAFALFWQITIRKNAYMLASAGSSASFIVPVVAGLLFFDESFTLSSGLSIALIVLSLFFLLKYDSTLSGKTTKRELALVLALVLSQGLMQCMQKVYVLHCPGKSISVYNFYYFLFAFLFSLLLLPLFRKPPSATEDHPPAAPHEALYMVIMAGALFAVSFFQTMAAKTVDAIILYPLISGLSLVGGALMAAFVFREKPDRNGIIGILLVLSAVVISKFSF